MHGWMDGWKGGEIDGGLACIELFSDIALLVPRKFIKRVESSLVQSQKFKNEQLLRNLKKKVS